MNRIRPEAAGIRSENILKFVDFLEQNRLQSHSLIISRGDDILFETYWDPFRSTDNHRMYSVTKSFVSIAIGFLEQDGLIDLDDPISKYFPKETENQTDPYMRNQTIRHMLMMSTAKKSGSWFDVRANDRVAGYFSLQEPQSRPSGTSFEYDSTGSFILCALVERITRKTLLDYLREKVLDKIGFSKCAHILKCPGGHSWGDSALLCTPMDLWKTARWTLNGGSWNGEQLLNSAYLRAATSKQVDNNPTGILDYNTYGYGYQFWRTRDNSYMCFGMGCQYAVCSPDTDMIMVCTADNQGIDKSDRVLINAWFDLVENTAEAAPLPENDEAYQKLLDRTKNLKLQTACGAFSSSFCEKINGVTYTMDANPMGITKMGFEFNENGGVWKYTNAQGDKELPFGIGHNEFAPFPETGYSDEIGGVTAPGNRYHCAASAAWVEEQKLLLKVQIIDKYLGNLNITFGFRDDMIGVRMVKTAEDFLDTYEGFAAGKATV